MEKAKLFLPINLQFFAEDLPEDKGEDLDDKGELTGTDELEDKGTGADPEKTGDTKSFTQEELDRIVKDRLERERKKREEALEEERKKSERERLLEQEKYKDLYESLQKDLEAQRATALQAKKESLLVKAGYTEDQAKRYLKFIDGETDDELNESLDALKVDIPPKKSYGDPSPGNGGKQTPAKKNLGEKGKAQYERLKSLGKIKGRK